MKFDIYHIKKTNFVAKKMPEVSYAKVGIVEAESLDDAYNKTQNIESSWLQNPDVSSPLTQCRSTSVGDIIFSQEEKQGYMVMQIGFKKVNVFK